MATWRELITQEMKINDECWNDVIDFVLEQNTDGHYDEENLDKEPSLDANFDNGYGCAEGCYFQLWTKNNVYFPVCYDGSEFCGSASRNPNGKALIHQGGG